MSLLCLFINMSHLYNIVKRTSKSCENSFLKNDVIFKFRIPTAWGLNIFSLTGSGAVSDFSSGFSSDFGGSSFGGSTFGGFLEAIGLQTFSI